LNDASRVTFAFRFAKPSKFEGTHLLLPKTETPIRWVSDRSAGNLTVGGLVDEG